MCWSLRGHKWCHSMVHTCCILDKAACMQAHSHAHMPGYSHARARTDRHIREHASVLLYTYIACLVIQGIMGMSVWWWCGTAAGSRLQSNTTAAKFIRAVGGLAEGCCYTGAETIWRETQFCQGCKTVLTKMVILQVSIIMWLVDFLISYLGRCFPVI